MIATPGRSLPRRRSMPCCSAGTAHSRAPSFKNLLSLQPGEIFKREQLQFSQDVIESRYRDGGHADVEISTGVVPLPAGQVDVTFDIQEVPQYHIGGIAIRGNRLISGTLVQRELGISPGDVFRPARAWGTIPTHSKVDIAFGPSFTAAQLINGSSIKS